MDEYGHPNDYYSRPPREYPTSGRDRYSYPRAQSSSISQEPSHYLQKPAKSPWCDCDDCPDKHTHSGVFTSSGKRLNVHEYITICHDDCGQKARHWDLPPDFLVDPPRADTKPLPPNSRAMTDARARTMGHEMWSQGPTLSPGYPARMNTDQQSGRDINYPLSDLDKRRYGAILPTDGDSSWELQPRGPVPSTKARPYSSDLSEQGRGPYAPSSGHNRSNSHGEFRTRPYPRIMGPPPRHGSNRLSVDTAPSRRPRSTGTFSSPWASPYTVSPALTSTSLPLPVPARSVSTVSSTSNAFPAPSQSPSVGTMDTIMQFRYFDPDPQRRRACHDGSHQTESATPRYDCPGCGWSIPTICSGGHPSSGGIVGCINPITTTTS